MGATARQKQKKKEKARSKRKRAKQKGRIQTTASRIADLHRRASQRPFGPAWISSTYRDDAAMPPIIHVVVTRELADGALLPALALIDPACLGVKDAMVMDLQSRLELEETIHRMSERSQPLEPCDHELARSVVFNAIEHARRLGFTPHADFAEGLFLPAPEPRQATTWCSPERPFYVPGPNDDVERVVRRLAQAVGEDGFDCSLPAFLLPAEMQTRLARKDVIDWALACEDVPFEHVLAHHDLTCPSGRAEAVDDFAFMLETDHYLRWEAVIRQEQDLPLTEPHEAALDELCDFTDDDDEDILYIDEIPRPAEPWYETARKLADAVLIDRFTPHSAQDAMTGVLLLKSIDTDATHLPLPRGCTSPGSVLAPEVRHRLRVQTIFDILGGLGPREDGGPRENGGPHENGPPGPSLADPNEHWRLDEFKSALIEHRDDLEALGWSPRDLLERVDLPDPDKELLADLFRQLE